MKFRISSKDLLMFVIFAGFLLYLCAVATTNISYFGATGSFYGLNPLPGFTEHLGATIVLFLILIVLIFTSVSSLVFERKKGLGIEIGEKDNKGYSRWAKDREIKSDKGVEVVNPLDTEAKVAGIPLINDGKNLWVDNGEYHNLVIGSTGSGKSQTIVEPMVELLIKKGESMIITDPKGELYKASSDYMRERGYHVVVLNFRDPQNGNAWNPLTLPYQYYKDGNLDKATELLDDVALNILYDPNNKGEPFWEKSAADYFSGLALGLFEDAKLEEINLNSINYMSTVGEEKFAASNYIKEYFTLKGEDSNAYIFASNTINSPADTKGGILSVFRQKIRLFASRDNLSEMLAYSDFDMRDIGKEKTAVFIVIHDEKTTYHSLATIFIKQMYETLIDVAHANGGQLPYRTNFILDEFANMPPLKDVTTMVTAARSRSIRFTFIIQNFAQLKSVYGNEDAETIKGNCGNLIYLISTELAALEEISKMCGEVKSSDKDKTASTPLVTVTDLQKLKLFEAIIIRWRLSPFKTKYTPNFKMNWGHAKTEAEFPTREKKVVQKFDVKEFTKKKKGEKIKSSLNDNNNFMPSDFNPFKDPSPFGPSSGGFGDGSNPFSHPNNGLFGGMDGGLDLDAMMRDIDRKIAELDAEEARQKEAQAKLKVEEQNQNEQKQPEYSIDELPKLDEEKVNKEMDMPLLNSGNIKDVEPVSEQREVKDLNEAVPFVNPSLESYNIFASSPTVEDNNLVNLSDEKNNEVTIGSEKANIAVATSSPVEEVDNFDTLPKVENVSIIQPSYNSKVVKTNDDKYDIYNSVPNIIDTIKDEVKSEDEVKEEIKEFKNQTEALSLVKEEPSKVIDNYNIYNSPIRLNETETLEEDLSPEIYESQNDETNVNIDPDKIVINDNSAITDDEFFDDFFGDD